MQQRSGRWRGVALLAGPYDESASYFLVGRGVLGDAIGRMYAERYFSAETRTQVQAIAANIIAYRRAVGHLGRAVDRKEWAWSFHPQTVTACELPLQNALSFPAAYLEPPYFHPQAPAAVNYGAIGVIIGHEISHTLDTEGSTFDSTGRVRNWWKVPDLEHFNAATAKLAAQYDAYRPLPHLALNGKQTLEENLPTSAVSPSPTMRTAHRTREKPLPCRVVLRAISSSSSVSHSAWHQCRAKPGCGSKC